MRTIFKICIISILLNSGLLYSQVVSYVVPDTGSQGNTFPITVHGTGTEWTVSPYFVIYFDSIGVGTNNVSIINDTTLTGNIIIDGKASTGFHKCIAVDQFLNFYYKDSAFSVFLNKPVAPTLLLPLDNSINALQNPYFLWDSNFYAVSYQFQVSTDSLFGTINYDTVVANTPFVIRLGVLSLNTKYFWRVKAFNALGQSPWSTVFRFRVRTTGIVNISGEIPTEYKLFNNYPNPFNSQTKIKFQVPKDGIVRLRIYDISGKEVGEILNNHLRAGVYEVSWNAGYLSSGVYFYLLESNGFKDVKRAVLLK
ncbi:MAG: T9SS type A sorting domain-containing protein [Ignavibacteriae bacterium]|nr:T9SS type A sorting domain-containing protein [Ignavibacteriota bacterium]